MAPSRLLSVTVAVAVLIECGCGENPFERTPTGRTFSVAQYASKDHSAGFAIRPIEFADDMQFGSLPIEWLMPENTSLTAMRRCGIDELAVFFDPGESGPIEFATAARLKTPLSIEELVTRWNGQRGPLPFAEDGVETKVGDLKTYKLSSGSLLPAVRRYGTLRFLDRFGAPSDTGINVGAMDDSRGYVEGKSRGRAVFTFNDIDEAAFADGPLRFELKADVFDTVGLSGGLLSDRDYRVTVRIQNPQSGIYLNLPTIYVDSHKAIGFELPRRSELRSKLGGIIPEADVVEQVVSNGQVDVSLRLLEPNVYLGVRETDLCIRPRAYEYAATLDRDVIVARSPEALSKMMVGGGDVLSKSAGDLAVNIKADTDVDREGALSLLEAVMPTLPQWKRRLRGLRGALDLETATASLRVDFIGGASAPLAWMKDRKSETKEHLPSWVSAAVERQETVGELAEWFLIADTDVRADWASTAVELDEALDGIGLRTEGSCLVAAFTPPSNFRSGYAGARPGRALLDVAIGRDLRHHARFEAAERLTRRCQETLSIVPAAAMRSCWEISFNQ